MKIQSSYEYFFHLLEEEKKDYHSLSAEEHIYLSRFLERHMDPLSYFSQGETKLEKPTLAFLLKEALEESSESLRINRFQKLGEAALYTLGVFPLSLQRSLVGADYYVSMGSQAFEQSHDLSGSVIFSRLSKNFVNIVDLLNISMATKIKEPTHSDLLSMWSITGSKSLEKKLVSLGFSVGRSQKLN